LTSEDSKRESITYKERLAWSSILGQT